MLTCVTGARFHRVPGIDCACLITRNAKKIMEARLGVMADDIPEPEGLAKRGRGTMSTLAAKEGKT